MKIRIELGHRDVCDLIRDYLKKRYNLEVPEETLNFQLIPVSEIQPFRLQQLLCCTFAEDSSGILYPTERVKYGI